MILTNIRLTLRNFRRHPFYSFINVFSLAIGLAACIAIYLFIADESGFDKFHSKGDRIFRLIHQANSTGSDMKVALTGGPFGPNMIREFPEIESYTRFWADEDARRALQYNDTRVLVDCAAMADSTFFDIFDFDLLYGDRSTMLSVPNSAVITEETAIKLYGDPSTAIGKTYNRYELVLNVTGVLKNIPENSHLQFDVIESMSTRYKNDRSFNTDWTGQFLNTYFLMRPNASVAAMQEKFPEWLARWSGAADVNTWLKLVLQPFNDIHLKSTDIEHDYNNYRKFNGTYLSVFSVIAFLILVMAGMNFVNLTLARSSDRSREVGVRKFIGAKKGELMSQFIIESVALAIMALILALGIDGLLIPALNSAIGRHLSLISVFDEPGRLLFIAGGTLAVGILLGSYPSVYMASFRMADIIKDNVRIGKSGFRSGLIVVQFALASAMIVGTLLVTNQLSFMRSADLGFEKDQVLIVGLSRESNAKYDFLKNEMLRNPHVKAVTASGQRIGNNFHQWSFNAREDSAVMPIYASHLIADPDYLKVYGIELLEGRSFSDATPSDRSKGFVINETLAKKLKVRNVIGTAIDYSGVPNDSLGKVIGVVRDFNFNSLHQKIADLVIAYRPDLGYEEMSVKVEAGHIEEVIEHGKKLWSENIVVYPFTYSFLDDHFEEMYKTDQQLGIVISIMSALGILIASMGLLGLVAITIGRRMKEIAIRKVLGATVYDISVLLSLNFGRLILLSFILACPITWLILSEWLNQFAYRTSLSWYHFAIGAAAVVLIAVISIGMHTIRAARSNPAERLKRD